MKQLILKQKDLADYRESEWTEQNGICPLCSKPIYPGQAVLDHDHKTGHCRAVLCRNCNGQEGRVKTQAARAGIGPLAFLKALVRYWEADYSHKPIHPKHKSEEQKEIQRIKKKISKLKTDRSKPKYLAQIKKLQEVHNAKFE